MTVIISYGSALDQVTALRLQALGAVNGLTVYVPPAYTRHLDQEFIDPDVSRKIQEADVVLGVILGGVSPSCRSELNLGLTLKKSMIVMSDPIFAPDLQPIFGSNLVIIDPANPGRAETDIVHRLKSQNVQKGAATALIALGTVTLGLMLLSAASKE